MKRIGWGLVGMMGVLGFVLRADRAEASNVVLRTPAPQETSGGEWDISMKITLDQAPATAPILYFTFTEITTFESTIEVRGQPPVVHQLAVDPPHKFPPESMPVDTFTDTVTHNPVRSTLWTVPIKRAAGYEAGIFQMEVSNSDGQKIGSPMRITLNGNNPPVDRAAISFGGNIQSVHSGLDAGAPQVAQNDDSDNGPATSSTDTPAGSAAPMVGAGAFQETPEEMHEHPKGCGCSVVGMSAGGAAGAAFALGAAGIVVARRRRGLPRRKAP
jgi:hypothetical protein